MQPALQLLDDLPRLIRQMLFLTRRDVDVTALNAGVDVELGGGKFALESGEQAGDPDSVTTSTKRTMHTSHPAASELASSSPSWWARSLNC